MISINEKLGVPENMEEVSNRVFEEIKKMVSEMGDLPPNVKLGDEIEYMAGTIEVGLEGLPKKEVPVQIGVHLTNQFKNVGVISMAYSFESKYGERKNRIRGIKEITSDFFVIDFASPIGSKPSDFLKAYERFTSSSKIAHELMHFYDFNKGKKYSPKLSSDYQAIMGLVSTNAPSIFRRFCYLIYLTTSFEATVKPSEFNQEMKNLGIKKKDFKKYLESSKIYREIDYASKLNIEELKNKIEKSKEVKDFLNKAVKQGYVREFENNADEFINLIYINIANRGIKFAKSLGISYAKQDDPFSGILSALGISLSLGNDEASRIAKKTVDDIHKEYIKYSKAPQKYFEKKIKETKESAEKIKRKLAKLYDNLNESNVILDWDLYSKIKNREERNKIYIEIDFDKFKI